MVVAKIQSLTSQNVTLDEEIEEQERRNSLLMKRIADAKAQLSSMQQSAANLYTEWYALDETSEKFSEPLNLEVKKLNDIVGKKRTEIVEVKADAEMVPSLREEKDRVAAEIARLQDDLIDAEIDVDNLTTKFQYELGIMILFPFWKLEEELDKVLTEQDSTPDEGSEEHVEGYDEVNEEEKVSGLIKTQTLFTSFVPFNYLKQSNCFLYGGDNLAEWFSRGAGFEIWRSLVQILHRVQLLDRFVQIANWSASHQLGFLMVYILFRVFSCLFTVSPAN